MRHEGRGDLVAGRHVVNTEFDGEVAQPPILFVQEGLLAARQGAPPDVAGDELLGPQLAAPRAVAHRWRRVLPLSYGVLWHLINYILYLKTRTSSARLGLRHGMPALRPCCCCRVAHV